jgi:hypothetical protein
MFKEHQNHITQESGIFTRYCKECDELFHIRIRPERLRELTNLAKDLGARDIWILRGATLAKLIYSFDPDSKPETVLTSDDFNGMINLKAPHELVVIIGFPVNDGWEVGIEKR